MFFWSFMLLLLWLMSRLHADSSQPHRTTAVWEQREQVSSGFLPLCSCAPDNFTFHFCLIHTLSQISRWLVFCLTDRRLLEKSQRIEAILASLQASGAEPEQLTEVEEMITAPEKQQLESLRLHINKYAAQTKLRFPFWCICLPILTIILFPCRLDSAENQVDETIFLLESYINSTVTSWDLLQLTHRSFAFTFHVWMLSSMAVFIVYMTRLFQLRVI